MATDDMALLRQYARNNSQTAFSALMSRYVNMVYSVALRSVRDSHLAEDVTQTAFVILARKAGSLGDDTILSAWLCRTARYAAANALTIQRRRQRREREAQVHSAHTEPQPDAWALIAPLLEPALARLSVQDHDAIVLRFFEGKNYKEVAAAMGTGEDNARMRVNRALEKLRKSFGRHGVAFSTAVIASVVSEQSVQAAAPSLAATITSAAAHSSMVSATAAPLVKGTLKLMAWAKIKVAALTAAALLTLGTVSVVTIAHGRSAKNVAARATIQLPPEVQQQLTKQKAAMSIVYLEYAESYSGTLSEYKNDVAKTYAVYFDGSRFYHHERTPGHDNQRSFDGKLVYMGTGRGAKKMSISDAPDLMRYSKWCDWPYPDAAGFYAPSYVTEMEKFSSLEPVVLHYLEHSDSAKSEAEGDNLRVTLEVEDVELINVRQINLDDYQKDLERRPNTREWVADEIKTVKRLQSMKPTRKVSFLLDAKHGYAVAEREEWTAAGERIVHIHSDGWKYYAVPGVWLPERCVAAYYTSPFRLDNFSDQPVLTVTHELKAVEFGKKDISFNLNSK